MADGTDRTPQAASRRLLNATALMAAGTLISRVLGFVKAGLLVIALGATTAQADTYSVATVVPNTLYMLVAGGALNTNSTRAGLVTSKDEPSSASIHSPAT